MRVWACKCLLCVYMYVCKAPCLRGCFVWQPGTFTHLSIHPYIHIPLLTHRWVRDVSSYSTTRRACTSRSCSICVVGHFDVGCVLLARRNARWSTHCGAGYACDRNALSTDSPAAARCSGAPRREGLRQTKRRAHGAFPPGAKRGGGRGSGGCFGMRVCVCECARVCARSDSRK